MSGKCAKCGTDDVILTRCSWCGRFTAGQTDLARLREENAALKRDASTRLAERDLFVQASNESTTAQDGYCSRAHARSGDREDAGVGSRRRRRGGSTGEPRQRGDRVNECRCGEPKMENERECAECREHERRIKQECIRLKREKMHTKAERRRGK